MPVVHVDIQPEVIRWALSQTPTEKLGDRLRSDIDGWLDGTKSPTFDRIQDLSRKSNIPLGYFSCRHLLGNRSTSLDTVPLTARDC